MLAARYLGTSAKAWMIEDFAGGHAIAPGQEVLIPKREWNVPGIYPSGYQLVPVLVYNDIAVERKGRDVVAATAFEEQMRYLKANGFHAIRLDEFLGYLQHARQLPAKSVLLTFDDGHKAFVEHARPLLKELGFSAVLFVQSDQIRAKVNAQFLSWAELRDLAAEGFEVQAHSKTHRDLRQQSGESDAGYARRMRLELEAPLDLLRKNLPGSGERPQTVAYPYGTWDQALLSQVKQYGYVAGFTAQREANPAFVAPFKINRSQVSADWTLDEFRKNLPVFHRQPILPEPSASGAVADEPGRRAERSSRAELAAAHTERSASFESRGQLRQALQECQIALTIDPGDAAARGRRDQLATRIESAVAGHIAEGQKLARSSPRRASGRFLAALALDPASQMAFDALRDAVAATRFLTHTVKPNDTATSLADLYYGDRSRAALIEEANGLQPGSPLAPGTPLKIPEVPGVPFLRPDR
jgi:peptidoglycan/xylan/chitin deacetylase (PgdA/CDA1 family)